MFSNMDKQAYGVLEFAYREAQNLVKGGYYNCEPEQLLGCIERLIRETKIINKCDIKVSDLSMKDVIYDQVQIDIYTKLDSFLYQEYQELFDLISKCGLNRNYTIENRGMTIYVDTAASLYKLMEYCSKSSDISFIQFSDSRSSGKIILRIDKTSDFTVSGVDKCIKDMSVHTFDINYPPNHTYHVF